MTTDQDTKSDVDSTFLIHDNNSGQNLTLLSNEQKYSLIADKLSKNRIKILNK